MERDEKALTPSDVVGEWVRELRRQRGWTAKELETECGKYGAIELTAPSILNIETGRRDADGRRRRNVTVEELLALSRALAVAPVSLLFPMKSPAGGTGDLPPIAVTPGHPVSDRLKLRKWAAGVEPLDESDFPTYFDDDPDTIAVDEDRIAAVVASAVQKELDLRLGGTATSGKLIIEVVREALAQGADLDAVLRAAEKMIEGRERMAESVQDWQTAARRIIADHRRATGE